MIFTVIQRIGNEISLRVILNFLPDKLIPRAIKICSLQFAVICVIFLSDGLIYISAFIIKYRFYAIPAFIIRHCKARIGLFSVTDNPQRMAAFIVASAHNLQIASVIFGLVAGYRILTDFALEI